MYGKSSPGSASCVKERQSGQSGVRFCGAVLVRVWHGVAVEACYAEVMSVAEGVVRQSGCAMESSVMGWRVLAVMFRFGFALYVWVRQSCQVKGGEVR